MPRARKPHPADLHAAQQIARSSRFSIFRARGRGANSKEFYASLAEARAAAEGDPRAMIYAITPEGFSIHVPASYKP